VEAVVAPRVRIAKGIAISDTTHIEVQAAPVAWSILPRGKLGLSFSCGPCSSRTDPETGETIWSFTGPLEVIGVTSDGPAALAGIERGDVITTINAEPIESEEGGESFSQLVPGEEVTLTVVKRSGEEVEVSLIPVESKEIVVAPAPAVAVTDVEPVIVEAVELPPPPPTDPESMVLRYSGTVGPAEVEVRGGPVGIKEQMEEGILIIITRDARIQIRVPRSGRQREDGVSR
jgi:membrane-associated protease RseP (regulator of RpoE activity)